MVEDTDEAKLWAAGKRMVVLEAALRRHMAAVRSLGEIGPNKRTYFEEDVTKSDEAQRRWKELNDAGVQARLALGV